MALSNKHKKRIDRKFNNISEELEYTKQELIDFRKSIYTMMACVLFLIFCGVVLFDQIVGKIFFPYINISKGMGGLQIGVAIACIVGMVKLMGKVK